MKNSSIHPWLCHYDPYHTLPYFFLLYNLQKQTTQDMSNQQKYTPVPLSAVGLDNSSFEAQVVATPVGLENSSFELEAHPRVLELVSPATLPENYTFEVDVEGQSLMVKVPAGGTKEGQKISVPFPSGWTAVRSVSAPVGRWKDGLCECCRHGPIHPLLWNAWYCPLSEFSLN